MKKDLLFIVGLFALIVGLLVFNSTYNTFLREASPEAASSAKVKINNLEITAEIAKTSLAKSKGLSQRENLPPGSGMLFVFDEPKRYKFWMKDVKFPIDIIWISEDKKIVDISPNAKAEPGIPDNLLRIYQPAEPAKFVLEIPTGHLAENNIRVGDQVEFQI